MSRQATYTLQTLQAERAELKKQIQARREGIARRWDALFAPPAEASHAERITNNIGRVIAVYDGVMTGYKLLRQFRHLRDRFRSKKKRRK